MRNILAVIFFLSLATSSFAQEVTLKIHFIEADGGEAILVQTQDKTALVDSGTPLSGYKILDYLKENNVNALDYLIATHSHVDHVSGVFFILPKIRVKNTCDNGFIIFGWDNPLMDYYTRIFRQKGLYRVLKEGDIIRMNDVTMQVLWPPKEAFTDSSNYSSMVIVVRYKGFKCLLTADINIATEHELTKRKEDLRSSVLKIAHHGGKDATDKDFLRWVGPKTAIICVDENEEEGFPDKNVLKMLRDMNIKTYRTDESGTIVISVYSNGDYKVHTER